MTFRDPISTRRARAGLRAWVLLLVSLFCAQPGLSVLQAECGDRVCRSQGDSCCCVDVPVEPVAKSCCSAPSEPEPIEDESIEPAKCPCKAGSDTGDAPTFFVPTERSVHGESAQLMRWVDDGAMLNRVVVAGWPASDAVPRGAARTNSLRSGDLTDDELATATLLGGSRAAAWSLLKRGPSGILSLLSTLRQ